MLDSKKIDDLANKLSDVLPPGAKALQQDLHGQFKQILQSVIAKMELVTREEFDVQTKVLARTRLKIEALEKKVAEMEDKLRQA